jgi:hypothetical protein
MVTKADLALSAPPAAVAGASYFGYTLPEWAAIVTIVYTGLLIMRLLRKEWHDWMDHRARKNYRPEQ